MTKKTRLILLAGVLAVTAAAAAVVSLSEETREEIRESGEVVFQLPAGDVTAVSWTYTEESAEGETSLAFHRAGSDSDWLYDGDEAFPVDGEQIEALLDPFTEFRAAFVIEEVTDYAQYGLEDPVCTIRLTAGETEYEILVGNYSELDSQRYLTFGDGIVYLVNEDPMDVYGAVLDDFLLDDDIPYFSDVESVAFTRAENQTVLRDEDGASYREEDIYFLDGAPLDTDQVDSYLSLLSGLSLDTYATYKAAEADLAAYGLDDPELTVTVTCRDDEAEEVTSVSVSRAPADRETPWSQVLSALEDEETGDEAAADYEDTVAYLRVGESAIVYEISFDDFREILACAYDDLRHSEVLPASFEHVQSLSVTLDGVSYTLTREEEAGEDEAAVWSWNGASVDISSVEAALTALSVSSFDSGAEAGPEEISLTAVLDLEGNPEVSVALYRADGETCVAEADGEVLGSIPRSQAVELVEALNAIVLN